MKILPFPPGAVVHVIISSSLDVLIILSTTVSYVYTQGEVREYHLTGRMGHFREDLLFGVYDNAVEALKKSEVVK